MVNVLFVCTGNICRSPTADGVFAHLVEEEGLSDRIGTDSCGTIDFHAGEAPDPRSQETALQYGVDISHLRARQFQYEDFERFHYIMAMDDDHLHTVSLARPKDYEGRLELFCQYAPKRREKEVPDPYYGGVKGFEKVFKLVSDASEGLLDAIVREHFPDHDRAG